jgi:hypothetical protein
MKGLAKHLVNADTKSQIVLVKTGKDEELYQAFRQKFTSLSSAGPKTKLIEISESEIGNFISKNVSTVFVVPSTDKVVATKFMNNLYKTSSKITNAQISVYGTKEWVNYDDIKGVYKNKFNFHFASSNDFNYSYDGTKALGKIYRKKYNADLSKVCHTRF